MKQNKTFAEEMLTALRNELYEGSWDKMITDLQDRKNTKPFIPNLIRRIDKDLTIISKLKGEQE